ncbi:MAG: hypothetical protein R3C08_06555 [Hyphomonas sp.]|nr:hypothetical protein [Hyphomonas sp.]
MPSKLILTLIAAGAAGAAAVAGTVIVMKSGSAPADRPAVAVTEPAPEMPAHEAAVLESVTDAVRKRVAAEMEAQTPQYNEDPVIDANDFGAAPDMSATETASAPAATYGIGLRKLPSPPARACVTTADYTEALWGSGCDCSCDGYAQQVAGPASRQCDLACAVGWYACWAPDATDEEVAQSMLDTMVGDNPADRAAAEPGVRDLLSNPEVLNGQRVAIMAERAFKWQDQRICPE